MIIIIMLMMIMMMMFTKVELQHMGYKKQSSSHTKNM
jgi:hypothetical protein